MSHSTLLCGRTIEPDHNRYLCGRGHKPRNDMSSTTKAKASNNTARKAKAKKKKPAAIKHVALTGIAKRTRNGQNGKRCAKHELYDMWVKAPLTFDAESAIKKLPKHVAKKPKLSTVRSWVSNWGRGLNGGGFYPAHATAKAIGSAVKKLSN